MFIFLLCQTPVHLSICRHVMFSVSGCFLCLYSCYVKPLYTSASADTWCLVFQGVFCVYILAMSNPCTPQNLQTRDIYGFRVFFVFIFLLCQTPVHLSICRHVMFSVSGCFLCLYSCYVKPLYTSESADTWCLVFQGVFCVYILAMSNPCTPQNLQTRDV